MGWKNYIVPPAFHKKASEIHRAIVKMMGLAPQWSKRNYANFAKEGYNANVWAHRCIQAIAQGAAGVPWVLYMVDSSGKRKEILGHDLLKLLDKPNELTSRSELIEAFAAYALIAGNSYLDMVGPDDKRPPKELWVLRPDRMQVVPHSTDFIAGYVYNAGGSPIPLDKGRIGHLKYFNPIDDFYGLSPIEVAGRGIDNDNAANAWNNSLLTNGARPGGALVTEEVLTEAQYNNLKTEMDSNIRGAKNAGKPMLLEGGLKWQNMSLSPQDMEFINAKKMSILEICAAFGVPPEIVGYGENKTYSNYEEARKALYIEAVLPMLDRIRDKFNAVLVPKFGDNLYLDYNKDAIEALQDNRDAVYKRATEAYKGELLTKNEAREEMGYGFVDGGDEFYIPPTPALTAPKVNDSEGKKGHFFNVKSLNIETEEQKTLFWKAMESGRETFYERAIKAIQKQFEAEHKAIIKAYKNGGEDAAIKAIDKKGMQKLLTGIYVEVMDHFGTGLMDQFKKDAGNHMETKAPLIAITKIFNVFDKAVQKFISTTVAKKVVGISLTTEKAIRKIIKKAEKAGASIEQIAEMLDKLYLEKIIPNRSEVIARTEVIGASNAGNAFAADQTGLNLEKSWLSTRDERTRETHDTVDGQKRPKHEHYDVGKAKLMFPGDPEGPAEEVIQCRCTETYKVIKGDKPKPAADPKPKKPKKTAMEIAEDEIRGNKTAETGIIFDAAGNEIWRQKGDLTSVDITEAAKLGLLEGNVLTHNHPGGSSFSPEDIQILAYYNMGGMRAVSTKHNFNATMTEEFKKLKPIIRAGRIRDKSDDLDFEVRKEFKIAIDAGKMTVAEANANHWHEVWKRIAELGWIDYTREEIKK